MKLKKINNLWYYYSKVNHSWLYLQTEVAEYIIKKLDGKVDKRTDI